MVFFVCKKRESQSSLCAINMENNGGNFHYVVDSLVINEAFFLQGAIMDL
jgi:hypothetical protein